MQALASGIISWLNVVLLVSTHWGLEGFGIIQLLDKRTCLPAYLEVLSSEQLNAHDGEDEPEDQTHEEHIENGWYGLYQSVYHNLGRRY